MGRVLLSLYTVTDAQYCCWFIFLLPKSMVNSSANTIELQPLYKNLFCQRSLEEEKRQSWWCVWALSRFFLPFHIGVYTTYCIVLQQFCSLMSYMYGKAKWLWTNYIFETFGGSDQKHIFQNNMWSKNKQFLHSCSSFLLLLLLSPYLIFSPSSSFFQGPFLSLSPFFSCETPPQP